MSLATTPFLILLLSLATSLAFSQQEKRAPVCSKTTFAAWKPIPKLSYPCRGLTNEWDDKILRLPSRVRAKRRLLTQLESFVTAGWWRATTEELSACDVRRKPGTLDDEEKERLDYDYRVWLLGDNNIRLVSIPDPCFQTEYNGSTVFILYRKARGVVASEVLDGYFSRADNSLGIEIAKLNGKDIIEVSTGSGGLHPELTNYYFMIDPKTHRAVPKNLFQGNQGSTNRITSALLMSDPENFGLPADAESLRIIVGHKLVEAFSTYAEDEAGRIDDNGRRLSRRVLKWDGKLYR